MPKMANVVAILPEGFEEIEAVTPIDLWRRAGLNVTVASLGNRRTVTGRSGITLQTDTSLAKLSPLAVYDVLFLPGGPGVKHLRASPELREWVGRQAMADRWLAAICAAPTVLHDAGLLAGRRYTAHFSVATELPDIRTEEAVVVDGRLITSRGAGTAVAFALQVITEVIDAETAGKIAESICAQLG